MFVSSISSLPSILYRKIASTLPSDGYCRINKPLSLREDNILVAHKVVLKSLKSSAERIRSTGMYVENELILNVLRTVAIFSMIPKFLMAL